MKIIKNEKLIQRNGRIGVWMSLAALVVLGLGMYISLVRQDLFIYALIALVIGFGMTQIGMYMGNRYSRKPRPDEKLDAGLKGLPGDYTLYHYSTPAPHVLVGPSGLWLLKPYHQHGQVVFKKNRYQMSGGGFVQSYMRIFGQESLGRPEFEIEKESQNLTKRLAKVMDESSIPVIKPVLVFTSEDVEIDAEGASIPAVKLKQLKDFFRQKAKEEKLSAETIKTLNEALA